MNNFEPGNANDIHLPHNIDVVIGMDATGSMGSWINAARDTVLEAFTNLRAEYADANFRIGLVCYRDHGDREQYVTHPLTDQIEDVQNQLRSVIATGGNDTSEDVAGGLRHITEIFRASPSENPTRILLFVADAPAHGLRYHSPTVGDRFPKGDPNGLEPFDQARELATMGVDMTLFRISKEMDKMIEEFAAAYNTGNGEHGTFVMLDVVSQGVSYASSSSSASSFGSIVPSPITSGYIDLASYDEEPVYRSMSSAASAASPMMPPPNPLALVPSPSCEDHFRSATYGSVSQSVQKRRDKKSDL